MKNVLSNVVMLPTEKASYLFIIDTTHFYNPQLPKLSYSTVGGKIHDLPETNHLYKPQHLYFTTDEEIKEGDHIYEKSLSDIKIHKVYKRDNKLVFFRFKNVPVFLEKDSNNAKKIVASTDESLGLPRPSNEFLKAYCKKGGIDQVLIEYEVVNVVILTKNLFDQIGSHTSMNGYPVDRKELGKLKVAPDNTITIHPVKEKTYTRDEVLKLLTEAKSLGFFNGVNAVVGGEIDKDFDNWIKNNL